METAYNFGYASSNNLRQPTIKLEDVFPPSIPNQESHDELLSYLTTRLTSANVSRQRLLQRMVRVDRSVSTWQRLSDEDSQRKVKQDTTGQAQAISMNLPVTDSHLDDMVSFFAGVYSPEAGDVFQMPESATQENSKPLVKKLNSDAKATKYYKNLCGGLRALLKYNIGGYALSWIDPDDDDPMYTMTDGLNKTESIDMYNVLWDQSVSDPSLVRTEAEWAARVFIKNPKWLVDRDQEQSFHGVYCVVGSADKPTNGRVATWYKYPPNFAELTGEDQTTGPGAGGANQVNWISYGASLASDQGIQIGGHEVIEMYCWLNPADFHLASVDASGKVDITDPNAYKLWKFFIADGKRIIAAKPVFVDQDDSHPARSPMIPYFMGYLKQDDMGAAQRSIAELIAPFQAFGSFLLNTHVAGVRSAIWGIQGYDPSMFDMGGLQPGTTTARIPSKTPGRDVRTGLITLNGKVETSDTMDDLAKMLQLMKEFFPAQAVPSQVASIDRAVTSQVQAVLQGINRRLHMFVRILDDDILGPLRMSQYVNVIRYKAIEAGALQDSDVERILGSGIAQLNREAAATALQQLLFALIQSPQSAQGIDVLGLMNYWSSLINVSVDLTDFAIKQPAPGEVPGQPTQQTDAQTAAGPEGVDPAAAAAAAGAQ